MNNNAWRKLAFATGGIVLGVASLQVSPAFAGGLTTYDFKVTNLTGVLAGKTFDGSFSFKNANFKKQGFESFCDTVGCGDNPSAFEIDTLVDFEFNFLGRKFTQFDEPYRRTSVYFWDGVPTNIFYHQNDGGYQELPETEGSPVIFVMTYTGGGAPYPPFLYQFDGYGGSYSGGSGAGDVIFSERVSTPKPTPEPATLGGLSVLGLGLLMSRKKKTQKSA
jgi:hypothetical protein